MTTDYEAEVEGIENHAREQMEKLDLDRWSQPSPAEEAYRKRRSRLTGSTEASAPDITSFDPVIQRLAYVIDQILLMAPEEVKGTWQFKTVAAMITEAKKDLRRLPVEQVVEMSRNVGAAFAWVADGSMDDLEESDGIDGDTDRNSDGEAVQLSGESWQEN